MRLSKRAMVVATALAMLIAPSAAPAQDVAVSIDSSAAAAVLAAVRDPNLTRARALEIARLPGNQGLIRKARSYGRTASDELFAQALVAAAHHDTSVVDVSKFHFDDVRDHAAATEAAMADLNDPQLRRLDTVKARIAAFTPKALGGHVTGYLVVGGTSGGFAFGEPTFYLDIDRFPSAVLASTIMEHELFHAVQALARSARKPLPGEAGCLTRTPHAGDMANLFASLSSEGTASLVGDVLALPTEGGDEASRKERERVARNVGTVDRSITQLELSVHGLATGAEVTPEEIYALGFYGNEVLYALGYVMARAIAAEEGDGAVGDLIGQSGAALVNRYVALKGYGRSEAAPALKPETIRWAKTLAACSGEG